MKFKKFTFKKVGSTNNTAIRFIKKGIKKELFCQKHKQKAEDRGEIFGIQKKEIYL